MMARIFVLLSSLLYSQPLGPKELVGSPHTLMKHISLRNITYSSFLFSIRLLDQRIQGQELRIQCWLNQFRQKKRLWDLELSKRAMNVVVIDLPSLIHLLFFVQNPTSNGVNLGRKLPHLVLFSYSELSEYRNCLRHKSILALRGHLLLFKAPHSGD